MSTGGLYFFFVNYIPQWEKQNHRKQEKNPKVNKQHTV